MCTSSINTCIVLINKFFNCLNDFLNCINDLLNHSILHRSPHVLHYHYEPFIFLTKYVHNEMLYVLRMCTSMQDTNKQIECTRIRVLVHNHFQCPNTYGIRVLKLMTWHACTYDYDHEQYLACMNRKLGFSRRGCYNFASRS